MYLKIYIFVIIGIILSTTYNFAQSLVIVTNEANSVETLSLTNLKKIYYGDKQRWDDGEKIILSMWKVKSPEGEKFLENVYEMSFQHYNKYWLKRVFRGEGQKPKEFDAEDDMMVFISNNPGSIGFINAKSMQRFREDAKISIIKIDGKLPGDPGYALE